MSTTTLQQVLDSNVKLTPMMEQYSSIKENYKDHLLLFRMGDFYEVFFEDAVSASKLLNITLTHRGKIGDFPIPMAGIPHHAAAVYIDRLSNMGLKVAICEQVQDPKDAKGIVKRAVTQVVSPGMPFDLDKTEASEQRFMASALKVKVNDGEKYLLVVLDFTTGEFDGLILDDQEALINKLRLYSPRELMTFMGQWDENDQMKTCLDHLGILTTYLSEEYFDPKYTEIYTEKIIPGHKRDKTLKAHSEILGPIGALAYYVTSTQNLNEFFHIRPFRIVNEKGEMKVTLSTLQGLEILPKSRETYKESLLGYMDKTQTAMGSRKLKQLFATPLYDLEEIKSRQGVIQYFLDHQERLLETREQLSDVRDLERILAKVSTNKINAGDLLNTAKAIDVHQNLAGIHKSTVLEKQLLKKLAPKTINELVSLSNVIEKTINDEIGASLDKGNLIKPGCHPKRDKLAHLAINAEAELTKLEERYREETGIAKLRIKSNNVAGYFIEISKSYANQVPATFQRRQTLVNSERYTTDELNEFEKEVISASELLERMEREIFKDIVAQVATLSSDLQDLSDALSLCDSLQSLSWMALQDGFTCPEFTEGPAEVQITQAWHPLIKNALKDQFVCHDLNLNSKVFFGLITGPNMAGKTTVMREVAIIQTLAQIGSFIPAQKATIGLCDFLFSRLGASDDILKGQSTFMVEMAETAEIIRHATEKSLVILDEVGRGTSTYDGLSIAWALCEHLIHNTRSITLFATHYHELIDVIDDLPQAKNLTVETQNRDGNVQFLYRLIEQGASQSFGIYVAKLAGLPPSLLHRAEEILHGLEGEVVEVPAKKAKSKKIEAEQLSFFPEGTAKPEIPKYLKELESEFKNLDINNMTPLQMMNKVQALKEIIQ